MTSNLLPENYKSNVTFSNNGLIESLNNIKIKSFDYLRNMQRDLVGYDRYDYGMTDFKLQSSHRMSSYNNRRYVIEVPKDLITVANRELYKDSNFINKEITTQDISSNPDMFGKNFLIFINGEIYNCFNVLAYTGVTQIVLYVNRDLYDDGIAVDIFDKLMEEDAQVTILFLPNMIHGNHSTNKYALRHFDGKIPNKNFTFCGKLDKESTPFASIVDKEIPYKASLLNPVDTSRETIDIDNSFVNKNEKRLLDIDILSFKYLEKIIQIPAGGDFFELPIKEYPVPITSFLPFYEDDDGTLKFLHDGVIDFFYPSIYRFSGNDKPISLFILYNKSNADLPFENDLELYYRFFGKDIIEKYRNNTIPEYIKNYVPNEYSVSIRDLNSSILKDVPLDYKVAKMNDFIGKDANKLRTYVYELIKKRNKMRIDVSKINLDERLRHDSTIEMPNHTEPIIFDEPMYVFTFTKYFINEFEVRFSIDGLFKIPPYSLGDNDYTYFYLPVRWVNSNTLIEIEKFKNIANEFNIQFRAVDQVLWYDLPHNDYMCSDVFMYDAETLLYMNMGLFRFIIEEEGKQIEVEAFANKPLGRRFGVKNKSEATLKRDLSFNVKKFAGLYSIDIKDESMVDNYIAIGADIARHESSIRVYKNGRFLNPDKKLIRFKNKTNRYTNLDVKIKKNVGDTFTFDIVPYRYTQQLYLDRIPLEGIIDLKGYINKPFDLKYFDVYINGFKLSDKHFDILTPTLLLIKNVSTDIHFIIMEKDWGKDIFKFQTIELDGEDFDKPMAESDKIIENVGDIKDIIDEISKDIIIDDTIEDIITDIIIDEEDDFSKLLPDIVEYILNEDLYFNPDIAYNKELYPQSLDDIMNNLNGCFYLNPDDRPDGEDVVSINPDEKLLDPGLLDDDNMVVYP